MFARIPAVLLSVLLSFALLAAATYPVTTTTTVVTTKPPVTSTVTITQTAVSISYPRISSPPADANIPQPAPSGTIPASQCNTGDIQCCNSLQAVRAFLHKLLDPDRSLTMDHLG